MKHTCTLNQFKRISGGRLGHPVTLKCRGCSKTLVIPSTHALYGSWQRWKAGEMVLVSKPKPEAKNGA